MADSRVTKTFVAIANSPRLLLAVAAGLVTVSSVAYSRAEHQGIINSFWWSIVTTTTVGYGDAYPHTVAGKFVAGLLMLSMVLFFIPMVTASFASRLIVNRDAFTHQEQEEIKASLVLILKHLRDNEK